MDGSGTLTALTPGDAGEVLTLQRAAFVAAEDLLPPQVRTIGLFTGQHRHASLRLCWRHGYRQTHTTQAGAYLLVPVAKARPHRSGAAGFRPGRS